MSSVQCRTVCWTPIWNEEGKEQCLEYLILTECSADSIVLAFDEDNVPFRLSYQLQWNEYSQLERAHFAISAGSTNRSFSVETDGKGCSQHTSGEHIAALDGCLDIDVWPTPFTNTFPIRREATAVGERREFRMAWVFAPALSIRLRP